MHNVAVTGGSRGLGLGIARKLAASGYRVIAIARNESDELVAAIEAARQDGRGDLRFKTFDLANIGGLRALVKALRQEFGAIYGLVNNAGIGTSGILATLPDAQIERTMRLNALSPMVMTKYVLRSMMSEGRGRIVNISSIVSTTGFSGLSVYGATKAAMVGFTRSLAREVGPLGITVNAVAPGFVDTEMTQGLGKEHHAQVLRRSALRRLALVEDIAEAVDFLISDKAKNITGTVLTIDAGSTA